MRTDVWGVTYVVIEPDWSDTATDGSAWEGKEGRNALLDTEDNEDNENTEDTEDNEDN